MEFLNAHTVALSRDALAIVDPATPRLIKVLETTLYHPPSPRSARS